MIQVECLVHRFGLSLSKSRQTVADEANCPIGSAASQPIYSNGPI